MHGKDTANFLNEELHGGLFFTRWRWINGNKNAKQSGIRVVEKRVSCHGLGYGERNCRFFFTGVVVCFEMQPGTGFVSVWEWRVCEECGKKNGKELEIIRK